MPKTTTYLKWKKDLPKDFLLALKISRFISHIKRLEQVSEPLKEFIKRALFLKENLGPFLLQLPPSFKCKDEEIKRLSFFIKSFNRYGRKKIFLAVEFRNKSCFTNEVFKLFKKHNVALVASHSSKWERIERFDLADFVYFRYHGPKELFASSYSLKFLKKEAQKIKLLSKRRKVFIYFNNDFKAYAVKNALTLKSLLNT